MIFEKMPLPIIISHSQTGKILYVNQRLVDAFGMDREHAVGRHASEFYADPQAHAELTLQLSQQCEIQSLQVEMVSISAESFWVEMSASLITFENNPAVFTTLLDISKHKELENRLENLVMTDALTGLLNRHYFFQKCLEEIKRVQRYPQPLSLLMLDIDQLKQVNETHGNQSGDLVLKEFSLILLSSLREVDFVGRVGPDEFAILIPNTDIQPAAFIAERLRQKIAVTPVSVAGRRISITVSVGVSHYHTQHPTLEDLLDAASQAVELAKQSGCNRVVIAPDNNLSR
jgi:diguanylate cyclase (GGDEF)-like protein/PAS domain S-box-containing protein